MKRVLIVDDAVFMRMQIQSMLENNGFEVIGHAGSGDEAMEQYMSLKPDIITLDITMPGKDGIQVLKEIRAIDKDISIVILSAQSGEESIVEAVREGVNDFIVKPVTEEELMKVIKMF